MRKVFIVLLLFLSLSLFASGVDSSTLEFSAYKNQKFATSGKLYITVYDHLRSGEEIVTGIDSIPNLITINEESFDTPFNAFTIRVQSNISNRVNITVNMSDFINPRFPDKKITMSGNVSINKQENTFYSNEATLGKKNDKYYVKNLYKLAIKEDGLNFTTYFLYKQAQSKNKGQYNFDSIKYQEYTKNGILEYLPQDDTMSVASAAVYTMKINKTEYDSLPEGVEFTSTVVINIEVD